MTDERRYLPMAVQGAGAGPPEFRYIAVVGLGALGGSLALALRRAWPAALVIGVDRADVIDRATRQLVVDVGSADLMIAGGADLVILAGSPADNADALARLEDTIAGDAVVIDVRGGGGGARAASLPGRLGLVAVRPVDAPVQGGLDAASAEAVGGCWHLAPVAASAEAVARAARVLRAAGADPVIVPPSDLASVPGGPS